MEDRDIYMFGGDCRGQDARGAKTLKNTNITISMKRFIDSFIDDRHSQG